ncbi:oxidase [Photobacterium gaetbulicola]|uniref:Oxidase n=1 Tax=Photobacterium gaetbulicola Gung47 TaxID=658445 RepID=A0A0C5WMA8_9GAMM|nr:alternative oxidase [Photobacterium gaetbulicola]AJR07472.1 hypothetical protein H744_2c0741 [Photobacterium gaetbulicola Gung47]PSU04280.1 oxidase [Photobacterium gaetbulicola]
MSHHTPNPHFKPQTIGDHLAWYFVLLLRSCADLLFGKRYCHRAIVLETVAAVPGMVGGFFNHLKALRRIKDDEGWIKELLAEAENERMHLMTFIEVAKPSLFERFLIRVTQIVFLIVYTLIYLLSAKTAHRIVGYFEEEAVRSYDNFLNYIDNGTIENTPAPKIALDYWKLPADAKLREVVVAVREDEMHHRDRNHSFADAYKSKQTPAHI